jgi:hypothetical protein
MAKRVRVVEIGSGMFPNERYVRFSGLEGEYSLFVDSTSVDERQKTMEVNVIMHNAENALVELPRETTSGKNRVRIRSSELIAA